MERAHSSLTVTCVSNTAEILYIGKEEFLRKFKDGSDPWRILVMMAVAKERTVADKIKKTCLAEATL